VDAEQLSLKTPKGSPRALAFATAEGLASFGIGFAGALLFWFADLPLPWMLGAMTATAVSAMFGVPWQIHRTVRDVARPVIGVLAGSAFTPAILGQAGGWAGILAVIVLFGIATTLTGYLIARFAFGLDRATAFFSSTPAGLTEMSLMGDSLGGNLRSLFLIHSIRVVAVVFCVPTILQIVNGVDLGTAAGAGYRPADIGDALDWALLSLCGLGGYVLGRRFRIPSNVMIFSMLLSAALHLGGATTAAPPAWLVIAVQVVIGSIAGARFRGIRWAEMRVTLAFGVSWAILVVAAAVATAAAVAGVSRQDFSAILLAIAPGGMAEMTIVTYALGIDVAFVVACQVLRNFATLLIAPFVYRALPK